MKEKKITEIYENWEKESQSVEENGVMTYKSEKKNEKQKDEIVMQ